MVKFPRKVTPKDLFKILEYLEFEFQSQKGSHVRFANHEGKRVTIPVHGNRAIRIGTLRNIIFQMGITQEQFLDLYQQIT